VDISRMQIWKLPKIEKKQMKVGLTDIARPVTYPALRSQTTV